MFYMEHKGLVIMTRLDARGSEGTHDFIFPELVAYYHVNGRMFPGLSTLVMEKISIRLRKTARSMIHWMVDSNRNWKELLSHVVMDSQVQSVLLERKALKTLFTAPWYNALNRGAVDYSLWLQRNPMLTKFVYMYGSVEHELHSDLDKILPPSLIKCLETFTVIS